MTLFSDFGLVPALNDALAAEGYTTPTPIQAQAIPHARDGRDLLGIAQTGTGKTAAFALPILDRIARSPKPTTAKAARVLVLAPTRELAAQIGESFQTYGRGLRLSIAVVYGGVTISRQERALARGVHVLVATPGRLLDLVDRRALTLSGVEILVLDEADQMLDLGFVHALKRIAGLLPAKRQSLFFSATMPKSIAELAGRFLTEPVRVEVTPVATTAERVSQQVMFMPSAAKQSALETIARDPATDRAIVFTRTKHGADRVVKKLLDAGIEAAAIHGNKSQSQRERALAAFRSGTCRLLVATDIAARGIDVEAVSHVVNFDLPNVPEQYVHRIGRTARAGAEGIAISFCADDERGFLRDIERLTGARIPVVGAPAVDPRAPRPTAHRDEGRDARRDPPREPRREARSADEGAKARRPRRRRKPGASGGAPQRHDGRSPRAETGGSQAGGSHGGGRAIGWLAGASGRSPVR